MVISSEFHMRQYREDDRREDAPALHVSLVFYLDKGESEGYTVKCKEKDFPISNYPLEQTEFFYAQKQARDKLENEKNKEFDYTMFHHRNGIA